MKRKIPIDFSDISLVVGFLLLGRGLYMIYPPVMYIAIGIILIWLGLPRKAVK